MNTKTFLIIAAVAVIGGCAPQSATEPGSSPPEITTDVVQRQDLTGYSFFDGKLVIPPSAQAVAFSPYDTPVVSVSTGVGKFVEAGEPIIKLKIPGADEATEIARADANSASANYSADKAVNSGPVDQAEKALADAKAAEKQARDTVAAGGMADVEAATQARINAETDLQTAKQELSRAVGASKAAAQQAAATLEAVKADARKGIVRAPITGMVVSLQAQPGLQAKSKEPLATIIDYEHARVQGMVPAELKDLVVKDAEVLISLTGPNSDPLDGKVLDVTVAPPTEGQTSPGYVAVIAFERPHSVTGANLSVSRIAIRTGKAKDVLVVPVGAITKRDEKTFVSVKSGDDWVETPVETGITDGALIEVKSGLSKGDVVRVVTPPDHAHL